MERPKPDRIVDTSGTFCPVPIIETAKAAKEEGPDKVLLVIGTDPGIESDMPIWCKGTRNELVAMDREGERLLCWVRIRS
jgi:TusA-related sulfurtransferase